MRRMGARLLRWCRRGLIALVVLSLLSIVGFTLLSWCFPFPSELLDRPQSVRVLDRQGRPLLQLVGADDQWRMAVGMEETSPWLALATIAVEDERFESHPGVDPLAVIRAASSNLASGRVVSGASTLTMQVCRMMEDRPRGIRAKLIESFRALQLERLHDKRTILQAYLNLAPYGGNLRGVEAASLAYFGKRARDLSLAEAALIAGLPQSPSRLRPDRHIDRARQRQRHVLSRMVECGMITPSQADDARSQPLTVHPVGSLRRLPPGHSGWLALSRRPVGGMTMIDGELEAKVDAILREHLHDEPAGTDAAAVVIDIATGELRAMIGSVVDPRRGGRSNAALALRSPGSALKPFIYAAGFESHRLNERSTLHDIPIERAGWTPMNFDRTFSGKVTVEEALQRSLNIPAILAAEGVGLSRCAGVIEAAGIALPSDAHARGGLAVATGAVEVTLLDLTNGYATIGRGGERRNVRLFADDPVTTHRALSAATCAMLDHILGSEHRRPAGMADISDDDLPWFMWKTGTSSGRRDAWSVGHNRRFAVGVWIGRQSGAGDAGYVGGDAAEPVLARLFDLPQLRVRAKPAPPATWQVTHPLPPPREATSPLRIVSPAHGSRFIALDGAATLPLRSSRPTPGMQWFLNGRLLVTGNDARLRVEPGRHELRCVDAQGEWAMTTFEVR